METYKYVIAFVLVVSIQSSDCVINQTIGLYDCWQYCFYKYNHTKNYYNSSSGQCVSRATCVPPMRLISSTNTCLDQYSANIYQQFGKIYFVSQPILQFIQSRIINGQNINQNIVCNQGWKSSQRIQKISNVLQVVYYCDQELKDGEVYPMMHGEYFFGKLNLQSQLNAINTALGQDTFTSILTPKKIILIIFTIFFLCINIFQCFSSGIKKITSHCKCCQKQEQTYQNLTESQKEQLKQFLQKRKENIQKAQGDIKYFSIGQQINKQKLHFEQLKRETQEHFKQKQRKKLQKKQKQLQTKELQKNQLLKKNKQRKITKKVNKEKQNTKNTLKQKSQEKQWFRFNLFKKQTIQPKQASTIKILSVVNLTKSKKVQDQKQESEQ